MWKSFRCLGPASIFPMAVSHRASFHFFSTWRFLPTAGTAALIEQLEAAADAGGGASDLGARGGRLTTRERTEVDLRWVGEGWV